MHRNPVKQVIPDGEEPLDLTRFCLEPDPAESRRLLAWVNSIGIVFLIIGLCGLAPHAPAIVRQPVIEEAVLTVIEPVATEIQTITATDNPEGMGGDSTPSENNVAVAVTIDSPAVVFSVPTVGNLLVPLNAAQAPPPKPLQAVAPLSSPRVERIGVTGVGGSRPPPPYPDDSLRRREQGRVLLFLEVNESGRIAAINVKESSGHVQLDRSTLEYVRTHWFFPPATGVRQYEAPIVYRITPN